MTLKSTLGDSLPEMKHYSEAQLKTLAKKKPKKKIIIEKCYECIESESDDEQQQKRPLKNIRKKCESTKNENSNSGIQSLSIHKNKKMIKTNCKKSSIKKRSQEMLFNKKNKANFKNSKLGLISDHLEFKTNRNNNL